MTERRESRVSDETLGAYLDGELDAEARRHLEARLAVDAAARARLEALRRVSAGVGASVRRARDSASRSVRSEAREPAHLGARVIPLPGARIDRGRAGPRRAPIWAVAVAFAAGAAFGVALLLPFGTTLTRSGGWEQHALAFHESYLESLGGDQSFPLDARTSDPIALGRSLAGIMGEDFDVPDLSARGYTLQGARLITSAQGPVAYLLYSSEDEPLLGVAVVQSASTPRGETLHERGDLRLLEWSDGQNSFGLGGTHSPDLLRSLAVAVQSSGRALPAPANEAELE